MQLFEKYRPKNFGQIVGQDKAITRVKSILDRPDFDRDAFWIEGDTGTGKTTLAQCIAEYLGCPPGAFGYEEIDGIACDVARVRELQDDASRCRLFTDWRVIIINEAHAMTKKALQAWLTFLEKLPAKWCIIFTTTENTCDLFGNFHQPFMGRVKPIGLTKVGLKKAFALRLREIAQGEGLDGRPITAYQRMVHVNRGDFRSCLQAIELGELKAVDETPELKQKRKNLVKGRKTQTDRAKKTA